MKFIAQLVVKLKVVTKKVTEKESSKRLTVSLFIEIKSAEILFYSYFVLNWIEIDTN